MASVRFWLVIFASSHTFIALQRTQSNQIKLYIFYAALALGTWVAAISACVVVNVELVRIFLFECGADVASQNSDNIHFYIHLWSMRRRVHHHQFHSLFSTTTRGALLLVFQSIFMNYECQLSNCFQSFISISNSFGLPILFKASELQYRFERVRFDGNRQCSRRCQSILSPVTIR